MDSENLTKESFQSLDFKEIDLYALGDYVPLARRSLPAKLSRAKFYMARVGIRFFAVLEVGGIYEWKGRRWTQRKAGATR